jgi:hypothetical protein
MLIKKYQATINHQKDLFKKRVQQPSKRKGVHPDADGHTHLFLIIRILLNLSIQKYLKKEGIF